MKSKHLSHQKIPREKSSFLNEQDILDSKNENLMLHNVKKFYYDKRMILKEFAVTSEKQ